MFLHVLVNEKVKLQVDSRATLSIISPDVFHSVVSGNLQLTEQVHINFNRSPLKTDGLPTIIMQYKSESFTQMFAFAEIDVDVILGRGFLNNHICSNLTWLLCRSLRMEGKRYNSHMEGRIRSCSVTLAKQC